MIVYCLRHASAGQPMMNAGKDEKRPLDEKGVQQAHDVGRALAALKVEVDAIISSPLRRAFQTAQIVGEELGHEKVISDDALRPGAGFREFEALLGRYAGKKAIMVAGHNPNLSEFLNQILTGTEDLKPIEMKKAAVAMIEQEGSHTATLMWYMPPKVIRSLQKASARSSRPKTVSK